MHYCNGLPDATPGFLDGTDTQYPDWKRVLPNPSEQLEICVISQDAWLDIVPTLKAFGGKGKKAKAIKMNPGNWEISQKGDDSRYMSKLEISVGGMREHEPVGVNPEYLISALTPLEKKAASEATIKNDGKGGPISVEFTGFPGKAIIMPMRFE
jgi:hypothetical protein